LESKTAAGLGSETAENNENQRKKEEKMIENDTTSMTRSNKENKPGKRHTDPVKGR
jgi:hypothetical protein